MNYIYIILIFIVVFMCIFVAFNKVITAQYFTWYTCILPICSHCIKWDKIEVKRSFVALLVATCLWLFLAFLVEMKGCAVFMPLWCASLLFFLSNIAVVIAITKNATLFVSRELAINGGDKKLVTKIQ